MVEYPPVNFDTCRESIMTVETFVRSVAGFERIVLRMFLYLMILYGFTSKASDPIDTLTIRLHFLMGVCTLAVVAWISRPLSSRPQAGPRTP